MVLTYISGNTSSFTRRKTVSLVTYLVMNQDGFVLQVEEKQHTKAARVIRGLLGSSELGNYIQSNGRPAVVSISIYLLLHLIFHTDLLP